MANFRPQAHVIQNYGLENFKITEFFLKSGIRPWLHVILYLEKSEIIEILFEMGNPGKFGRMARILLISGGGLRFSYFRTAHECAWKQPAASLECRESSWLAWAC